jgi:hypothetical protein
VLETDDWREQADRTLPAGWYEQAIADANTFFEASSLLFFWSPLAAGTCSATA